MGEIDKDPVTKPAPATSPDTRGAAEGEPDALAPIEERRLKLEKTQLELEEERFELEQENSNVARRQTRRSEWMMIATLAVSLSGVAATALVGTYQLRQSVEQSSADRARFDKEFKEREAAFSKRYEQELRLSRAPDLTHYWVNQLDLCQQILDSAAVLIGDPKSKERSHFKVLMRGRAAILEPYEAEGLRGTMNSFLDRIDKYGPECDEAKYCAEAMACYCHVAVCDLLGAAAGLDAQADTQTKNLCKRWNEGDCEKRRKNCKGKQD